MRSLQDLGDSRGAPRGCIPQLEEGLTLLLAVVVPVSRSIQNLTGSDRYPLARWRGSAAWIDTWKDDALVAVICPDCQTPEESTEVGRADRARASSRW